MKWLKVTLIASFFILLFALTFVSNNDFGQDLGRHIKIGELIVKTGSIPSTNLFSYTNPYFPFINHHWFSEVLYFLLSSFFGFTSLLFLKVLLFMIAFSVVIYAGVKKAGVLITIATAAILSPFLLERAAYIRPEQFGYIFFAFILYILLDYPRNPKFLYSLPLIMLFWVNMHISFVFGFALIGILILKMIFDGHGNFEKKLLKKNFFLAVSGIAASLLNPHFLYGALYPFFIFGNYGYKIVENQNLFFLSQITHNPMITLFFWMTPVILVSIVILLIKKKWFEAFILTVFTIAPYYQLRHLPFFVLAAIPTMSYSVQLISHNFFLFLKKSSKKYTYYKYGIYAVVSFLLIFTSFFFFNNSYYRTFDTNRSFGAVLNIEGNDASEFLLHHDLPHQLFNNFDIGGYAIYSLYPKYKVFVDNRPEAYPVNFMENIYKQLQVDDSLRKEVFQKYNIHTIYFSHTDQTDWGRAFVSHILADKNWKLVYYDSTMMILSDKTDLPDVRADQQYSIDMINSQTNYISLLTLVNFLNQIGQTQPGQLALQKAYTMNPSSCIMKSYLAGMYENSAQLFKADDLKRGSWWCF